VGRLVLFNDASSAATQVVDVAWDNMPQALHASAGDLEQLSRKGAQSLRIAIDSLPPFGWRAIDLLPGAQTPAARVTVTSTNNQTVLANEHVRATFASSGGSYALTSLVIDGQESLAAPSFVVGDYTDAGGLWRLGNEMAAPCALTPSPEPAGADQLTVID